MSPSDATLVHGDFHHHNLLSHGDGWVVIDPKPMVGEPEFDVPRFLWSPIGHLPTRDGVERWIAAFADAGLDANRLRKWAIVRGTYEGLPLPAGLTDEMSPRLKVVRALL
jgi:streptomycin 6-kinase